MYPLATQSYSSEHLICLLLSGWTVESLPLLLSEVAAVVAGEGILLVIVASQEKPRLYVVVALLHLSHNRWSQSPLYWQLSKAVCHGKHVNQQSLFGLKDSLLELQGVVRTADPTYPPVATVALNKTPPQGLNIFSWLILKGLWSWNQA